jgi:WD domain, G-beta repeat
VGVAAEGAPQNRTEVVLTVAFSPDGRRIVSGADDNTLRLWDANTGQPIGAPLTGHTKQVSSVAFSSDGRCIISGSHDTTLRVWPAPPRAVWPELLCSKLTANMSPKQWREWVSPDIPYMKLCEDLPIPPDDPEETQLNSLSPRCHESPPPVGRLVQPLPPLRVLRGYPTRRTGDGLLRSTAETSRRLSSHTRRSPDSPGRFKSPENMRLSRPNIARAQSNTGTSKTPLLVMNTLLRK